MQKTYFFKNIFTGVEWLADQAVVIKDGTIEEIFPAKAKQGAKGVDEIESGLAVPAFVDVQVYGAAGRLFSAYPEAETLKLMNEAFCKTGTTLFLPTVATNTLDVFKKALDAVRTYWKEGNKGVHGLHLEGPWLNPEKKGAHLLEYIHAPKEDEVKEILEYGRDVIKLITIAPERCSAGIISLIQSFGITISAGHSNATYSEAMECFDKGIGTVTHLYNAMSPLHHRQPGLVGAVLDHPTIRASIVPDGYHVDYAAIRIAKKIMGNRLFAITDAVTETNTGPYRHQPSSNKYESNGILSGSALSMHKAFTNLIQFAGIGLEEAHRMCSLYPAEILGQGHRFGKIAVGFATPFLVLDDNFQLKKVITC